MQIYSMIISKSTNISKNTSKSTSKTDQIRLGGGRGPGPRIRRSTSQGLATPLQLLGTCPTTESLGWPRERLSLGESRCMSYFPRWYSSNCPSNILVNLVIFQYVPEYILTDFYLFFGLSCKCITRVFLHVVIATCTCFFSEVPPFEEVQDPDSSPRREEVGRRTLRGDRRLPTLIFLSG